MFERLTRWENNDKDVADLIEEKSDFDGLTEAINRLAKYEDSGLSPEEVHKLVKVLKQARESLQAAWEDDGSTTVGKQMHETIKAINELLKWDEGYMLDRAELESAWRLAYGVLKLMYAAFSLLSGEGGCKYCKTPPEYLAICQNYETRIFVGISGEYLQIFDEDYPGFCDNHKINFCPMCGRKLG